MKVPLLLSVLWVLVGFRLVERRPPPAPDVAPTLAEGEPAARVVLLGGRLDLRRATAADLEALPGIGRARARAIVSELDRRPGLTRLDDLAGAPGIGPETIARIRPFVSLE